MSCLILADKKTLLFHDRAALGFSVVLEIQISISNVSIDWNKTTSCGGYSPPTLDDDADDDDDRIKVSSAKASKGRGKGGENVSVVKSKQTKKQMASKFKASDANQ
ncbi:unnamed protein product [Brassica oleracea var. botrytis]